MNLEKLEKLSENASKKEIINALNSLIEFRDTQWKYNVKLLTEISKYMENQNQTNDFIYWHLFSKDGSYGKI